MKEKKKLTFEQLSEMFDVGLRTLLRWNKNIEPKRTREKPATKVDMEALAQDVEKRADDYQYERAKRLGVSPNAILYALRRLNISHKKNSISPQCK